MYYMRQLSIIIPVYNVEKYISKCLHSILDNDYSYLNDVEIICIDDGSTDNSGEICDAFAKKYRNIIVRHQSNRGVAAARNIGLSIACGKYIAWVDGDDYVEKEWLSTILNLIKNKSSDLILFDYYVDENKKNIEYKAPFTKNYVDVRDYIYELSQEIYIHSYLWQYIMRRSVYNSKRFDETVFVQEDYRLLTVLALEIKSIYYCKKALYHYVQHKSSLTHHSISVEMALDVIKNAKQRYDIFLENGFNVSKVGYWRAILGNYFILEKEMKQKDVARCFVFYDIKRDFWSMIKSKRLTIRMKIKLLLILCLPSSWGLFMYRIFRS